MRRKILTGILACGGWLGATTAPALERVAVRVDDDPDGWHRASTTDVLYYNVCTGWNWMVWDEETRQAAVFYSVEPDTGPDPEVDHVDLRFRYGVEAGYGYTGTISLAPVTAGQRLAPPLATQPFLPTRGWQTVTWPDVRVPQTFAVAITATGDRPYLGGGILADCPVGPTGPPACGYCYPDTRVSRSWQWLIGVPAPVRFAGDICGGAELQWEVGGNFHAAEGMPFGPYVLTMEVTGPGTVTPVPTDWVPGEETVVIEAFPENGIFSQWIGTGEGSYTGPDNPATITMNGPITQQAVIRAFVDLTVTTDPPGKTILFDGVPVQTPYVHPTLMGAQHWVDADSLLDAPGGSRERLTAWSDGRTTASRDVLIAGPLPFPPLVATYTLEHTFEMVTSPYGTTIPPVGSSWVPHGVPFEISALPAEGFAFFDWIGTGDGSYTGPANPATIAPLGRVVQVPRYAPLAHGYEFHVSADSTDPYRNSADPSDGPRQLYLWATCLERGISAMEASVTATIPVLGFTPRNGVLNAGTPQDLLLAIPACPTLPFLLGSWGVLDTGGRLCLGPSPGGVIATVDCVQPSPFAWDDPVVTGFASDGAAPCVVGSNVCASPMVPLAVAGDEAGDRDALAVQPNPSEGDVRISFSAPAAAPVALTIYDVQGRRLRTLFSGASPGGVLSRTWDGRDEGGRIASAGVYFLRLESPSGTHVRKLIRVTR